MKKIWIGAGLACMLALAGCGGGGSTTEAPKTAEPRRPRGRAAAVPDEANGATVTGKVVLRREPSPP